MNPIHARRFAEKLARDPDFKKNAAHAFRILKWSALVFFVFAIRKILLVIAILALIGVFFG